MALRAAGYPPRPAERAAAPDALRQPVLLSRFRRRRFRRPAAARAAHSAATVGRPLWALVVAMAAAFVFLLVWNDNGPNTTGLGLVGTLAVLGAVVYLFPRLPGRLLGWADGRADPGSGAGNGGGRPDGG